MNEKGEEMNEKGEEMNEKNEIKYGDIMPYILFIKNIGSNRWERQEGKKSERCRETVMEAERKMNLGEKITLFFCVN
jgi:hypothetical protein